VVNILIFVLATVAVTFTATIDTTPPAAQAGGVRKEIESEALNLTVFIVNDGFSLKASGGNIAPGCEGPGPGITIPRKAGQYDFASLTKCAERLKNASDSFKDETQVTSRQTRHGVSDHHQRDRCRAPGAGRRAAVHGRELQGAAMSQPRPPGGLLRACQGRRSFATSRAAKGGPAQQGQPRSPF
jgi:hypothetical protein